MNDKPKSIWKKSWIGRTLFVLACLATLIALFYAEEDWRGWHAWNKFKHEWEAKGEKFDFASVVPPPVPDDQNFALTPIVASCYSYILDRNGHEINPRNTNVVDRMKMTVVQNDDWPTNGTGDWRKSTVSDLKIWQQYYRALAAKTNEFPVPSQPQSPDADVLLALSKYDSTIEELRQAGGLPYSRFPLNYYDSKNPAAIFLPHLATLKHCSQVLQLRAMAELQNGQLEKALADVRLTLQLTDKIHTEPFLISHLVRIAMVNITLQPIWEGLAQHKWSDAQLTELDSELAKFDFLADYEFAIRGERGCDIGNIEILRNSHKLPFQCIRAISSLTGGDSQMNNFQMFALAFGPSGWFYQNELRFGRFYAKWYLPLADDKSQTVSPAAARTADAALEPEVQRQTPENSLEAMLLPSITPAAKKFAYAQTSVDLARVAIALERYRLAHGEFPEALDALAPQFIAKVPHDVIGGQPLKYRREASGQFVLYSVGWNETDDGGVVGLKKDGTVDMDTGDWVWRYPQK